MDALSLTLQEWNLDQCKQVAQLPRYCNILLACRLLSWVCSSCFGQNLNLAVNHGLTDSQSYRSCHAPL